MNMWGIIVGELMQMLHEVEAGVAHYLPRVVVLLVIALVGWLVAYAVKAIVRSLLRWTKFSKFSEHTGAAQLLHQAALPSSTELLSRFAFWVAWVGVVLIGVSILGIVGLEEYTAAVFPVFAAAVCGSHDSLPGIAGGEFLFARGLAGRRERQLPVLTIGERFGAGGHHRLLAVNGL